MLSVIPIWTTQDVPSNSEALIWLAGLPRSVQALLCLLPAVAGAALGNRLAGPLAANVGALLLGLPLALYVWAQLFS